MGVLGAAYLLWAAFYPGRYTPDSFGQLDQALSGSYGDWHPPIMAWVWGRGIDAFGSLASLMTLHCLALATGGAVWAGVVWRCGARWSCGLIPLLIVSPVVACYAGVVWKDVGFAFFMLVSTAVSAYGVVSGRMHWLGTVAGLLLAAYALGVRHNGALAVMPAVAGFAAPWLRGRFERWRLVLALGAVSAVFLVGTTGFFKMFNAHLGTKKQFVVQALALSDISGIFYHTGQNHLPASQTRDPNYDEAKVLEQAARAHANGSVDYLIFHKTKTGKPALKISFEHDDWVPLRRAWATAVWSEPGAYLIHRARIFQRLLEGRFGAYGAKTDAETVIRQAKAVMGLSVADKVSNAVPLGQGVARTLLAHAMPSPRAVIFTGWFWLALLVVEMVLAVVLRVHSGLRLCVLLLSSSGLLFLAPYFFVSPAPDFRYLYWCSIAASMGIVLLLAAVELRIRPVQNYD